MYVCVRVGLFLRLSIYPSICLLPLFLIFESFLFVCSSVDLFFHQCTGPISVNSCAHSSVERLLLGQDLEMRIPSHPDGREVAVEGQAQEAATRIRTLSARSQSC